MLAKGTQLLIGDAGSPTEVFTQVTAMTEINWDGRSWATEETTNNDAVTPQTTRAVTIATDGKLSMTFKPWDPDTNVQHALLETITRSGAARNFKLYHPGSSIGYAGPFEAFVSMQKFETPTAGIWAAKIDLTPTGQVADKTPALLSVAFSDAYAGVYATGNVMELTATFDEVVKITGTPRIAITLGSGTVYATYVTPSAPSNIVKFRYTTLLADSATAGQFSVATPIDLNGGTLKDMVDQNAAALAFTAPTTTAFTVN